MHAIQENIYDVYTSEVRAQMQHGVVARHPQLRQVHFAEEAARNIFPSQHIERWAFDVELLYLANTLGIPIGEVAVNWQEIDGSKVNLFESIPQMARDIFTIRACYILGIWKVKSQKSLTKEKRS